MMMKTKLGKSRGRKRYSIAFLFAIGIPIAVTMMAAITDDKLR